MADWEEKIKILYNEINFIGFDCMYHKKNVYMDEVKDLIPKVQEFAVWFLEGNQFGIENELYRELSYNLIDILKDCETAWKEKDRVLMMDALEQGITEYLKMFLSEEYLEERKTANVRNKDN